MGFSYGFKLFGGGGTGGGVGTSLTTQVLFNNAGVVDGDPGLTYDAATDTLTVAGSVDSQVFKNHSSFASATSVLAYGDLYLGSAGHVRLSSTAGVGSNDSGLRRVSAGLVGVTSGGSNLGSLQAGNLTAVALGTPTITAPLTVNGTPGATTYGYKAVAFLNDGTSTAASAEVTVATGPAVLNGTDNITIATPAVTNQAYYNLYRTTGGTAPPKLIYSGTSPSYIDDADDGSAETPATKNTTGYLTGARAKITGLASYANNAAALAAGLVAGDLYTITGSDPLALAVAY